MRDPTTGLAPKPISRSLQLHGLRSPALVVKSWRSPLRTRRGTSSPRACRAMVRRTQLQVAGTSHHSVPPRCAVLSNVVSANRWRKPAVHGLA